MKLNRIIAIALLCILVAAPASFAASMKSNVWSTSTRLSALLQDVQSEANVSADVWKTVGNEANSLANKLYGQTAGNSTARGLAKDARMHVRMLRDAALAGNAAEARKHAGEALPFVNKLADWSAPAKM